jgi:hypothetical protein
MDDGERHIGPVLSEQQEQRDAVGAPAHPDGPIPRRDGVDGGEQGGVGAGHRQIIQQRQTLKARRGILAGC